MGTSVKYSGWKRIPGKTYISAFNLGVEGLRISRFANGCSLRVLGDPPGTNYILFDTSVPSLTIAGSTHVVVHGVLSAESTLVAHNDISIADGKNMVVNTTTGTKIGTATGQKLGFWNATPVVQQAHIADPSAGTTVDAEARTAINAINALCAALGLTAAS